MEWRPVGPGTWQQDHEQTIDDIIAEQRDEAAAIASPAKVKFGMDPDPDEQMSNGVTYQRCGGGRRIVRKKIS